MRVAVSVARSIRSGNSVTATVAPSAARASAAACPRPEPAPVTMAIDCSRAVFTCFTRFLIG